LLDVSALSAEMLMGFPGEESLGGGKVFISILEVELKR
jgi:hypothetical protein